MADPMTPEQLAAIRARLDAATAGPWTVEDGLHVVAGPDPAALVHIADMEWLADTDEEWREFAANAAFVAAARQDVPALLAEVERLGGERAEVRDALVRELRASFYFRTAWRSARRGRKRLRAELEDLAAQNAKTETNFEEFAEVIVPERNTLARQVERVRARHAGQCGGACATTPCECGPDDLICAECETPHPCPTILDLDREEEASEKSGADVLLDHIQECHPDVKGLVASQAGPLDDEVAELERQGWTVERVEHVAGKRVRIMKPPAQEASE